MGRPKSAHAHAAVLDAAARLFADHGIETTSMDAIADAAGVSKATIYKHWPDKSALCLEVMTHLKASDPLPPLASTGDTRSDIVAFLERAARAPRNDLRARVMPHLWAYAVRTPGFNPAWRLQMIEEPRATLVSRLQTAIAEGELDDRLDPHLAATMLLGSMMYRNLMRMAGGSPPADLAARVVDLLYAAHGTTAVRSGGRRRLRQR